MRPRVMRFGSYILLSKRPSNYKSNSKKLLSIRRATSRPRFAICVKSLLLPREDKVMKLVEWIEFNLKLGVAKIIIYVLAISRKLRSVLAMYEQSGVVIDANANFCYFYLESAGRCFSPDLPWLHGHNPNNDRGSRKKDILALLLNGPLCLL